MEAIQCIVGRSRIPGLHTPVASSLTPIAVTTEMPFIARCPLGEEPKLPSPTTLHFIHWLIFFLSLWVSSVAGETTLQAEGRKEVSPLQPTMPATQGSSVRISHHMKVWLNSWPDFPVQVHNPRQENGDGPQERGCEGEEGRTTPMTCTDDQMRDVPSLCFCSLISKWSACGTSKIPPGEGFSLSPMKGREGWFPVPGERVLGSTSHVCQACRDGSQFLGKEFYDPLVMSARDTGIRCANIHRLYLCLF